jgi:hypothetical protein
MRYLDVKIGFPLTQQYMNPLRNELLAYWRFIHTFTHTITYDCRTGFI